MNPPRSERAGGALQRWIALQLRHPVWVLAAVAVVTALFAGAAMRLSLHTEWEALLPPDAPSVQTLAKLQARTERSGSVLVVLEGADRATLRPMGDELVAALGALGPGTILRAQDGVQDAIAYLRPRAGFFLETQELRKLADEVDERWDWEVAKAAGMLLSDGREEDAPVIDVKRVPSATSLGAPSFPDGYFERADGRALVVVARTPVSGTDVAAADHALSNIRKAVSEVAARRAERGSVRVSITGDLPTARSEFGVVLSDLVDVGGLGIALVLAVVALYFLRFRAVVIMAITIAVSLVWTFGATALTIGQLNVATAFLVSVVAGNGINISILYQSRYFEARARGASVERAVAEAVTSTWKPTAIAALASVAAYGSLFATSFRAFRDFGAIAAMGMLLCWVVKTTMVPPLLVLLDRDGASLTAGRAASFVARWERSFGRPFARLFAVAPRAVVALSVAVALGGTAAAVAWVRADPLQYDLRALGNERSHDAEIQHGWDVSNDILGASAGPMFVAVDDAQDAAALTAVLRARWRTAPEGRKPFVAVHALGDYVPGDQAAKLPLLARIAEKARRARERGLGADPAWSKLLEAAPPVGLTTFGLDDLPASVAAPFTDREGHRGTLVAIEAAPGTSNDLRELVGYADAFRETRLPNGKLVRGSGSAVIFADMLRAVSRDAPRAIALSLALTLATVLAALGRRREMLAVMASLWVSIAALALFLWATGTRIQFFNFAALPITFGIGVDYAINVAQRAQSGDDDLRAVLRTSGGAVVLCSLTTLLGYLALLRSHNLGIRSLGAIAAFGELACLLGAVVVLPAMLSLLPRAKLPANASTSTPSGGVGSTA
jgi:uncharacterized membrane protein YdfJ with MMPL/SSD domain